MQMQQDRRHGWFSLFWLCLPLKKWMHDQVVNSNNIAACTVANYSPLTHSKQDLLHKPTNVLPNFPTILPLDIAFQKDNSLFRMDTTTTSVALLAQRLHQQ
eukprot:13790075-Ditylum_brightwellii.AAC.1